MRRINTILFDEVREMLAILSNQERATIRTYLISFIEKGKESTNRSFKLFEILTSLKGKKMSYETIEKTLMGNTNPNAFNHQVARLKNKIFEGLLLDINVEREGSFPEISKATIEVRKHITVAQILIDRGLRNIAIPIFEKVIEQCKKYEFYDELLLALKLLIRQRMLEEGNKHLHLFKEYQKYDRCKNAEIRAEINYSKVISKSDFQAELDLKIDWLRGIMDEMSGDYKKTHSTLVGYYYYYLEAQFYQLHRNYKSARRSLLSVQRLLESSPAMNNQANKGGVLLNLADNDLFFCQFERSYSDSQLGLDCFKKNTVNYEQAVLTMFYAKFYNNEFQIAGNIIFQLFPEFQPAKTFKKGKYNYLLANAYFMMGDFATSLRYLSLLNPISADKEGWNMGIRILLIMTLIELKEFDEATTKIDALRKFLEKKESQNHRAKIIFQILQSLHYSSYDFKTVYQNEKGILEMLEENSGDLAWRIKSSEMVIFDQWFFSKRSLQPFALKINSLQIEKKKETTAKEEKQIHETERT
jgi:hypothetical protein